MPTKAEMCNDMLFMITKLVNMPVLGFYLKFNVFVALH